MADEIRNGDSKVRVVRLLGHRDDAGAWEIRDFLKRSVVEFQWVELSTEEDCRRELGLSDLQNVKLPVVELPDGTRLFGPTLRDVADRLGFLTKPKRRQYDVSIHRHRPRSRRLSRHRSRPPDQRQGPSLLASGPRALLPGDLCPGLLRRRRCAPPLHQARRHCSR